MIHIRCQYGDLWQLGAHRLLIGDCTQPQNVAQLMHDQQAHLLFTDPPYGMKLEKWDKQLANPPSSHANKHSESAMPVNNRLHMEI